MQHRQLDESRAGPFEERAELGSGRGRLRQHQYETARTCPIVIPVRPKAETGTHEHRTVPKEVLASSRAFRPSVFMGPGQPLRGFRDDNL
jgi:hypothetical protein